MSLRIVNLKLPTVKLEPIKSRYLLLYKSKDYVEKTDVIEDISISSLFYVENVIKGIGNYNLFKKAIYIIENYKLRYVE